MASAVSVSPQAAAAAKTRASVLRLLRDGMSIRQIVEQCGVTEDEIRQIARDFASPAPVAAPQPVLAHTGPRPTAVEGIVCEEPPPSRSKGGRGGSPELAAFAAALKENPGRWAVRARGKSSSGRPPKGVLADKTAYDWITRKTGDGEVTTYARYRGATGAAQ